MAQDNDTETVVLGSVFAGILAAAVGMVIAARRRRRTPVAGDDRNPD